METTAHQPLKKIIFFAGLLFSFFLFLQGVAYQSKFRSIYKNQHKYKAEVMEITKLKIHSNRYASAQELIGFVNGKKVNYFQSHATPRKEGEKLLVWYLDDKCEEQIRLRKEGELTFNFKPYAKRWFYSFLMDNLLFLVLLFIFFKNRKEKITIQEL